MTPAMTMDGLKAKARIALAEMRASLEDAPSGVPLSLLRQVARDLVTMKGA